jgi:glycosyltransferase involved in cell wall biosynthesis
VSQRRLRVTYVIDKLQRAGAQIHLGQLAPGLDPAAFDVEVVCLLEGGPVADEMRDRGLHVEVLDLGRLYAPRGLVGLKGLVARLRSRPVDILHTYLISSNIYGTIAGRLAGVGAIVTSRRDTGFSRNGRLRFVEEHFINPRVDRVVAVTAAVAEGAGRERGLAPGRVVTIENGVDLATFNPDRHPRPGLRAEWRLAEDQPAIGVVGHLSPVKGHADFLDAAAAVAKSHPRARFFVVGDGALRASLEARAASLGLAEHVVFTGVRQDIPRVLAALDVVVLSSHTEGLSNALLEAMAMARPIVATAVGGNPDVLRDGVTGRLVPARNPQALAAALAQLLDDPAAADTLGRAAREDVAARFSLQRMVARYESLYRELVPA